MLTDSKSLTSLPFGMSSRGTGSRDSLPVVFLEIKQGRTAFPFRPVQGNRFLIGSASCCDLCLGSQSVPQLHSLLHVDQDEVVMESVADFPLLKINGEIERSKVLCDGDLIEIGRFQLVARISSSFNASPVEQTSQERLENVHTILEPIDDDVTAIIRLHSGVLESDGSGVRCSADRPEHPLEAFKPRLAEPVPVLLLGIGLTPVINIQEV